MILSILLCHQVNWYVKLFIVIITKVQSFSKKFIVHLDTVRLTTFGLSFIILCLQGYWLVKHLTLELEIF